MPQQTNLKQIKEAARARGLNVEWLPETLQGQQGQPPQQGQPMQGQPMQAPPQGYSQTMAAPAGPMPGQAPPAQANLHPEAQAMMEAIGQYQRSTGPYIPFPGGTPTLDTRRLTEQQRQFDESMAWDRERWEADQAYRNAQLAARAAQSAPMDTWNQIRTIAEDAAKSGMTFDQVSQYIKMNAPYFGGPGNTAEAEQAALMFYEQAMEPALAMGEKMMRAGRSFYVGDPYTRASVVDMQRSIEQAAQSYAPPVEGDWEHVSGNVFRNTKTGVMATYDSQRKRFIPVELPLENEPEKEAKKK